MELLTTLDEEALYLETHMLRKVAVESNKMNDRELQMRETIQIENAERRYRHEVLKRHVGVRGVDLD